MSMLRSSLRSIIRTPLNRLKFSDHHGEIQYAPAEIGKSYKNDRVVNLNFIRPNNQSIPVKGLIGETLLECALRNTILFNDVCLGHSDPTDEWNIGLNCYQCHVHLSNEYSEIVNKKSPVVEGERKELDDCDEYHGDVKKTLACRVVLDKEYDGMNVLLSEYPPLHQG